MLTIGNLKLQGQAGLAPLAGINCLPFRMLCRRLGAAWVSSEMISCHGLVRRQPNTLKMLDMSPEERPVAFQLFGADPDVMAEAALILAERGADIVDLNFGCPVPKVVRHRGGAALLKEPDLLQRIVAACVRRCPRPVTVKIRSGWDENNAVEIARRIEGAGAAAVAVHARTRAQRFEGQAQWDVIREVVAAVRIPVIGNGDVVDGPSARRMLVETGCAAVLVGRGALGRPWVFRMINRELAGENPLPEPNLPERLPWIREHFFGMKSLKGERTARLEMRKHTAWYLKGLPGAAEIRKRVNTCETEAEYLAVLEELESEASR